jgi:hypothetical protein
MALLDLHYLFTRTRLRRAYSGGADLQELDLGDAETCDALSLTPCHVLASVLIRLWHSRHIAIVDSPRTDTTPGAGWGVEQSVHVGAK